MPRSSATSACSGPRSWPPRSAPSWFSRWSSACSHPSSSSRWDRRSSASWTCSASSARTSRNEGATMKRAMIFLVTALAGCASMPERGNETVSTRAERAAAEKLYAGQSPVVHATEFPVASAAEGIARGDMAWRQGKLDLAVYLYVQSLAYDSAMAGPFLKIAAIHEQLGNNALAEKAFELALERDPANAGACERLGLLYLESRQDEAAERLLHAAVRKDPNRWRAYNGLGILADRRAEYGLAEQHYDRAHLLQPNNASVINNRGYSHYLAGKPEAAEADLRYALQLGGPPGTWTNLGKALAKQGRHEEALESLLKEADAA